MSRDTRYYLSCAVVGVVCGWLLTPFHTAFAIGVGLAAVLILHRLMS